MGPPRPSWAPVRRTGCTPLSWGLIRVLQSANKVSDSAPDDSRRDDDLPKPEIDKFSGDPLVYQ